MVSNAFRPEKLNNVITLVHQHSLGDLFYLCGFKSAVENQYGAKVHFVIKPNQEPIMKMFGFSDYSLHIFDEDELLKIAQDNPVIKVGGLFVSHPNYLNDDNKTLGDFFNSKISFVDIFKATLGLPLETQFQYPVIIPSLSDDLKNKIEQIAKLDKIILIFPEANSTHMIPSCFLEGEVAKLLQEGYVVISSVVDKRNAIRGTLCLELSFDEALALALNCHKVISVRSGFSDIMAPFVPNHTVYYPDIKTLKLYSFAKMYSNIQEVVAPNFFMKKICPCFQLEQKNNQNFYKISLTVFRVKFNYRYVKYCVLGIPIWIIKKHPTYKTHLLFGLIPLYREKI